MNINLTINGLAVTVPKGTTILEAARKVNVHIPTLCDRPDLKRRAICRLCVVECDGNSKLTAACANEVWEGMNVITHNARINSVRKTITELLLANHPQNCLTCIRNKNCELQSLAAVFGICESPFNAQSVRDMPVVESGTLVRDMGKCIKCAQCIEVCQEVQTIQAINSSYRSHEFGVNTPYEQTLEDSNCVFCGGCAAVCPVGAIYEHDQTRQVWEALNAGQTAIAQVSPKLANALNKEFGYADGVITAGKMVSAIKLLGFGKIFNADVAANVRDLELSRELEARISSPAIEKSNLPMISGCSQGVTRFVNNFYPDLIPHLAEKSNRQIFADLVKSKYTDDTHSPLAVSFVPCIAQKYGSSDTNLALTAKELTRMIKLAGINITSLSEETFNTINVELPSNKMPEKMLVHGYARAREVLEKIRKGECSAQWVEIKSCPEKASCG